MSKIAKRTYKHVDYLGKLSKEEREWLQKFNSEFHDASYSEDPIHTSPEHRKSNSGRNNAAWADVANQSADRINERLSSKYSKSKYTPDDYVMDGSTSLSSENALIAAIDARTSGIDLSDPKLKPVAESAPSPRCSRRRRSA